MAETSISWCDFTFNPWLGCTKVSAACDFCYAATWAAKYYPAVTWGVPGQKSDLKRTSESTWKQPLIWEKKADKLAASAGRFRQRVFCASLADVFDNDADPQWRTDLWNVINATPSLDWLLLTKRPQNIKEMLPANWGQYGWKNVWLGTTAENQKEYDRRWGILQNIRAHLHFISNEPALEALNLRDNRKPDCIITGGESGGERRTFDLQWAIDLQDQCAEFNIPFFFKQDSSYRPGIRGRASDSLWNAKEFPT